MSTSARVSGSSAIRPTTKAAGLSPASLSLWYVVLLVPTLAFKLLLLRVQSGGDLNMIASMTSAAHVSVWWAYGVGLLPADCLEAFVWVGLFALVGVRLLRIPERHVAAGSVLLATVIGGANAVSLRQLGSLLSADTLREGWHWTTHNPDLILQFLTPRRVVGGLVAVAWTAVPVWLMPLARDSRRVAVQYGLPTATVLLFVYAIALGGPQLSRISHEPTLASGFWSASAQSMFGLGGTPRPPSSTRSLQEIETSYRRLVFPSGAPPSSYLVNVPLDLRRPRHVVLVTLETAPVAYYRLEDDPTLPVFNAMSRHAIVGERHYTTAPTTRLAIDSLIGGVYPQSGTARAQAGGFSTNGLAQVLRTHGYETSFFDPYYIDWDGPEDARMVRDLGFTTVEDRQQLTVPSEPYEKSFAARLRQHEARAFAATLDAIATASSHHRKAFVCLVTHLGHFDWLADDDRLSAPERIALIARQIDGLMGGLLTGLGARGLSDDVVIVAVGDHGLRFDVEFQALGQAPRYGDVTFQVPLLVYAPALLPAEVRVPYATSHIDIAPTLLYLVGISSDGLYLGDNILDRRLADRVTFLLSGTYPGLHPVDGFAWKDRVYASYRILNRVTVRHAGQADERPIESDPASPFTASAVRSLIDTGIGLFDEAADCFRWRWTKAPTNGHTAPR